MRIRISPCGSASLRADLDPGGLFKCGSATLLRNMSHWRVFFILASSKLTVVKIYKEDTFGSGSSSGFRSQIISAPPAPAPAPQHWYLPSFCQHRWTFFNLALNNFFLKRIFVKNLKMVNPTFLVGHFGYSSLLLTKLALFLIYQLPWGVSSASVLPVSS